MYTSHSHLFTHIPTWELTFRQLLSPSDQLHCTRFSFELWQMFPQQHIRAPAVDSTIDLPLQTQGWEGTYKICWVASLRGRRMSPAAAHGADITSQTVAVHFIWFWINDHTKKTRMPFGRTHKDTLREIETQHPLVSGWKLPLLVLFVQVHV